MKGFNTLDVGCGISPRGEVNVDLYLTPESRGFGFINPKRTKNFVLASVNNLPFRPDTFEIVYCFDCIEHTGVKPIQALKELIRVSKDRIEVLVPHRYHPDAKRTFHSNYFNVNWFRKGLARWGYPNIINTTWKSPFHQALTIIQVPFKIHVVILKGDRTSPNDVI